MGARWPLPRAVTAPRPQPLEWSLETGGDRHGGSVCPSRVERTKGRSGHTCEGPLSLGSFAGLSPAFTGVHGSPSVLGILFYFVFNYSRPLVRPWGWSPRPLLAGPAKLLVLTDSTAKQIKSS